uniref:Uncharacterized protein n=1 Tax=Oryza brachyantha TaxID=4533 RepID=J3LQE3_ORYBR
MVHTTEVERYMYNVCNKFCQYYMVTSNSLFRQDWSEWMAGIDPNVPSRSVKLPVVSSYWNGYNITVVCENILIK